MEIYWSGKILRYLVLHTEWRIKLELYRNHIIYHVIYYMYSAGVYIHNNVVAMALILMYHYYSTFLIFILLHKNAYNGKPRSFLPGFPSTKSRKITCCFRSSDFLLYRKSYMRTGKKSGTRHSHPLPWCSAKSCLLKS